MSENDSGRRARKDAASSSPALPYDSDEYRAEREALLGEIDDEFRMTASSTGRETLAPRVRQAIESVPRHLFVPDGERHLAYINHPLPIGFCQTISQPFIVALMTDLLEVSPDQVVLEVGTGSGYQAAILSTLACHVYSVEVIKDLAVSAAAKLAALHYANVDVGCSDGALGWPEHAPYARIIVTAAGPHIPAPLVDQLAPGGRLVAPVGEPFQQELVLVQKSRDGSITQRSVLAVAFVPLTHAAARDS